MENILFPLFFVGFCTLILYTFINEWVLKPLRIQEIFKKQGIDGPPPSFFAGNLSQMKKMKMAKKKIQIAPISDDSSFGGVFHDYTKDIFPYFDQWRKTYGSVYIYWMQKRPALYITDPALIKEISLSVSLNIGKPTYLQKGQSPLFGQGILKSNGPIWSLQRKLIAPEFYMDKIKGMIELMVRSAQPLLSSWDEIIGDEEGNSAVITVDEYFRSFSADVISRACFGSDYTRGKEIFLKLRALSLIMKEASGIFELPYLRFLPSKKKSEVQSLAQDIHALILQVVQERRDNNKNKSSEKDFLQSIIESGANGKFEFSDEFIVDNCKNIYFAGHETTSVTATWCVMLLATHPHWQDMARAEVTDLCAGETLNFDMISKMKTLTMIILETLRMFPPSSLLPREAFCDMKLGSLHVPKNVNMWIPISTMHHDPSIWGPDADKFNPDRFKNGVSGSCKHPCVFMPFGLGARTCLGQNIAMVELKVILALILQKFSFVISPEYRHSPTFRLIIEPEFGLPLVIKRV